MTTELSIVPNFTILLLPLYIISMAGLGLGFGIILSSVTTKYKDFSFLVGFGVQLLMYATPIIYPLSLIKNPNIITLVSLNPMTGLIEGIKYGLTGHGIYDLGLLAYSLVFTIVLLFVGVIIFNTDMYEPIKISVSERIAQIIFKKYENVDFVLCDDLEDSERSHLGYGSSGE